MVAIKVSKFGGMVPAIDDRLLADNQAGYTENARLLTGAVEPFCSPRLLYTPVRSETRRVYRIPQAAFTKEYMASSYWLEFDNQDVDVIHSPTIQDEFNRYYWAQAQNAGPQKPAYNTLQRIIDGDPPLVLGVPAPTVAPSVGRVFGKVFMEMEAASLSIQMGAVSTYKVFAYSVDTKTIATRGIDDTAYNLWGSTGISSSIHGQIGLAETIPEEAEPRNRYMVTSVGAELRYYPVSPTQNAVVDENGTVTVGLPDFAPNASGFYIGAGVQESRAYVYTWITAYGEESAPSPPTVYNGFSDDPWLLTITPPGNDVTTGRELETVRIYRTVSGVGGTTTYFFVADLPIGTTEYVDQNANTLVSGGLILQSYLWTPPPEDLEGMTLMPNGIICGWRKNEVWFCEPYRPHAWPVAYTVSVEYPIIGIGVIGQSAIICTTGNPYTASGINPATMAVSRIASPEPCIARGSIVSGQSGVLYASPNGLALAVPGRVSLVTEAMITHDQWADYNTYLRLPTLRAAAFASGYYCWGSTQPGCFNASAFDNDAFQTMDYTGSQRGAVIDLKDPRIALNLLTSEAPVDNVFNDHWTGETFIIRDGGVYWLDMARRDNEPFFVWRSKVFETQNQRNMAAMRIYYEDIGDPPSPLGGPFSDGLWDDNEIWDDTDDFGNDYLWIDDSTGLRGDQLLIVLVYADKRLVCVRSVTRSGEIIRLPSGFKAHFWQVEVQARVKMKSLEIATTAKELGNV